MRRIKRAHKPSLCIYKHGRRYRFKFQLAGKAYSESFATETEARAEGEKAVARAITEQERRESQPEQRNVFEAYLASKNHCTASHRDNVARYTLRLFEWSRVRFGSRTFDFRRLTRADCEHLRDWLLAEAPRNEKHPRGGRTHGLSKKSTKEILDFLSGFFRFAELPNPVAKVRRPKRTHEEIQDAQAFFTHDELQRMIDVCAEKHTAFLNGLLVFIHTGCRLDEIQKLRPEDMNPKYRTIRVVGKGRKPRILPLIGEREAAWDALINQMRTAPRDDGYIFPQCETWARNSCMRLSKSAFDGAVKIHPHKFRHTLVTHAITEWGWRIDAVADWIGDSVLVTLNTYRHLLPKNPTGGYALSAPKPLQTVTNKNPARESRTLLGLVVGVAGLEPETQTGQAQENQSSMPEPVTLQTPDDSWLAALERDCEAAG